MGFWWVGSSYSYPPSGKYIEAPAAPPPICGAAAPPAHSVTHCMQVVRNIKFILSRKLVGSVETTRIRRWGSYPVAKVKPPPPTAGFTRVHTVSNESMYVPLGLAPTQDFVGPGWAGFDRVSWRTWSVRVVWCTIQLNPTQLFDVFLPYITSGA
jgi:hypothetical protein